jgi:hypothetical protein
MASVLFSDLGGGVYDISSGWSIEGSGATGTSYTTASLFTVVGSGSLAVTEIDLAVTLASGPGTFYASIWTDNSGTPGTEVDSWSPLSTSTVFGSSNSSLVSITNITGLDLTGGTKYFMVLGPLSTSDDSYNVWNEDSAGVDGLVLSSSNGGGSWTSLGTSNPLGAFDILSDPSAPEPATWFMLAAGIAAIAMRARYRPASR